MLLEVEKKSDFEKINEMIHDCYFNLEDIVFNEIERKLSIKYKRLNYEERQTIKKILLLKKYSIPEYEYSIIFFNVNEYSKKIKKSNESWDLFNVLILMNDKKLVIKCQISIDLNINCDKIKIQIKKSETPIRFIEKTSIF